ncbi:carcinoembryonic antigen-related cell adhesion molecule 1-like isoform X2 [Mesocricetus auratus]|uniref:Carcinoembryonic antigen-related cell adhesion molecule 1-like isoform X2 n=1 Tax=Mesocricetus auratus TaxID=10036 RepID=A0ABM2WQQ7_MESAU|nr:carcinoembryonic antigen-related cell adhesion molecule 1-like isoform X2 [Mesocricetus auratus]
MQLLSAPPPTGNTLWQGFLLTASVLTFWSPSPTMGLFIEQVPPAVLEDGIVFLHLRDKPPNIVTYNWYRSENYSDSGLVCGYTDNTHKQGGANTGREKMYSNGTLRMQGMGRNYSGPYHALLVDNLQKRFTTKTNLVIYPQVKSLNCTSNGTIAVEYQTTIEFKCEPQYSLTKYIWKLNGRSITADSDAILSANFTILTLPKVKRHSCGTYFCEAKNPASSLKSQALSLEVIYGPDVPILFPKDSSFPEGSNIRISCVSVSHPKANYSWTFNGKPRIDSKVLSINNATKIHNGIYACTAFNPANNLTNSTAKQLTIYEPLAKPQLIVANLTYKEEDDMNMTCLGKEEGTQVTWLYNGKPMKIARSAKISMLQSNRLIVIHSLQKEDAGTYQCEIRNELTYSQSDPFHLNVLGSRVKRKT